MKRPFILTVLLLCLAGRLARADGPPVAPAQSPEEIVKALDAVAKNPLLLESALSESLRRAAEDQRRLEGEMDALKKRIDALNQAHKLLDAIKAPPSPLPPEPAQAAPPPAVKETLAPPQPEAPTAPPDFSPEIDAAFADRFAREIWPALASKESGDCFSCHGARTKTPLELPAEGTAAYHKLLRDRYFDAERPESLLAKLTSPADDSRMPPPPRKPLPEARLIPLRAFVKDLYDARRGSVHAADEDFPAELAQPYGGPLTRLVASRRSGADTTFLTYHQLRRKVAAIFHDDWVRDERDMFEANLDPFQGADFKRRFDESAKPSAGFLTALDVMAADVASRAYLTRSGPFENWTPELDAIGPAALAMDAPGATMRGGVARLYRRILFREPRPEEYQRAFELMRDVYATAGRAGADDSARAVSFDLTVRGSEGPATTRNVTIELCADSPGLQQQVVNESQVSPLGLLRRRIGDAHDLKAGVPGQYFSLTNRDSSGVVVFGGLEIVGPLPSRATRIIGPEHPSVELHGPWNLAQKPKPNMSFLSDGDANKGQCSLRIPLPVKRDGRYEIWMRWTQPPKRGLAPAVHVEVSAPGASKLYSPDPPARPPAGEAQFIVDQTEDRVPYADLKTSFRFEGDAQAVEISNAGTRKRVTADAVNFVPMGGGPTLVVDNTEAEGREDWPVFNDYPFRPYNLVGADCLSDKNDRKGQLKIRYKPMAKKDAWKPGEFYKVQITYAAQENNETRVPVTVRAAASSPIVRVVHPDRIPYGAEATLDASASYDLQGSDLKFEWKQTGGPKVDLSDPAAAKTTFTVRPAPPSQKAWEGLARALVSHPDFIFTRPPSLREASVPAERRNLLLVKIAQDLVARPPSDEEFAKLERGAPLAELIDVYLAGKEFEDFYFRRIRLALESHGSEEEDEAARLWTWIAANDRPFQEILTADYSVDTAFQKRDRPAFHGKTGVLTMKGFIKGKPGLPHFNYAAQVAEKFLGYVFEVPPEIVAQREVISASSTTNPTTVCYSCHKVLTPLAYQRLRWDDDGNYRAHDARGLAIDDSDQGSVPSYPFRGDGLEAFALEAQRKERFIRTMIDTHFQFYFGRGMRFERDERGLYRRLWDAARESGYSVKGLVRAILLSPEYLGEAPAAPAGEAKRYASAPIH